MRALRLDEDQMIKEVSADPKSVFGQFICAHGLRMFIRSPLGSDTTIAVLFLKGDRSVSAGEGADVQEAFRHAASKFHFADA